MKITFDYQGERRFVIINNYYSLWEILECIEKQTGEREIGVEYFKLKSKNEVKNE